MLRNLRVTDEKEFRSPGSFAALLVDTPQLGGRAVIDRLAALFRDHGLSVEMSLNVYQPSDSAPSGEADSVRPEFSEGLGSWGVGSASGVATVDTSVGAMSRRPQWTESPVWREDAVGREDRRGLPATEHRWVDSTRGDEITYGDEPLSKRRTVSSVVKRGVDIVGSLLGLIFLGPLLVAAMALIRLTSPGSAIFRQTREGLRGKPFIIYKLRTMVIGAESSQASLRELSHRDGPAFKIKSDPRVTRVGKILRATCVDELPQLLNVLRGDMSLVGPRPLPWEESRACDPWHRRRLDVRPGLTCHWQVNKSSVEEFDDWMRLDLAYVDRRSLWVDTVLLYRTISVALMGRGSC